MPEEKKGRWRYWTSSDDNDAKWDIDEKHKSWKRKWVKNDDMTWKEVTSKKRSLTQRTI